MKMILFVAAMATLTAVSCTKDPGYRPYPTPTVAKSVQFSIHQQQDYSAVQYNGLHAELKLAVSKFKKADGETIVLWDSAVPMQSIRNFPPSHIPQIVIKSFGGINDYTETVQASFSILYKNALNEVRAFGMNDFAGFGVSTLTLPVRL